MPPPRVNLAPVSSGGCARQQTEKNHLFSSSSLGPTKVGQSFKQINPVPPGFGSIHPGFNVIRRNVMERTCARLITRHCEAAGRGGEGPGSSGGARTHLKPG